MDLNEEICAMSWTIKWLKINTFLFGILIAFVSCKSDKDPVISSRVASLPYYQDPSFTPYWMDTSDAKLKGFHRIPSFSLFNQDGEQITEKDVDNHIYITDFFFSTCPGICPKMAENMTVIQDAFLEDSEILLISHTAMPIVDSVSVLKAYADDRGVVSNKWHLLTGDRKQLYDLGRKAYFIEEDLGLERSEEDFLHTENFVLIDKNRHIRGIYNGLNTTSIQQLITDVRTLKQE